MLPNQLRGLGHVHGRIGNDDRADADVASGEAPRFLDLPGSGKTFASQALPERETLDEAALKALIGPA